MDNNTQCKGMTVIVWYIHMKCIAAYRYNWHYMHWPRGPDVYLQSIELVAH